ncbi:MAG: tetratricopeptide repeat protein [Candidatus Obscuribacter sp.]|jgi:hypothetical protein|nr:tetratricopeptide repeat protein [Candidatus Obscuribacter sp.]MDQ5968295.1 Tetratricopeptide repeat protein [Cyanobacteriota bacterium erpe_2018_sw_39hr_WHONDRS-SW48-000098_B_bin.30]MBK7841371.1 tetratricopeptide repeat protein [Candidatus Obscuribacter sp.]MBK9204599.1 tetratricopeptide repeat protein [Candidatus Obscuribacter sp.]MBK9622278.1 tetratricopeptide repeat protein [Candidatus Obscuribacter sp.]
MTVSDGRKPGFGKKESGQAGPTKTNVASHKNFVIKNASQGMARGVDTGSNEVGLYDPDKEHEFRPPPWETLTHKDFTGKNLPSLPSLHEFNRSNFVKAAMVGLAIGVMMVTADALTARISPEALDYDGSRLLYEGGDKSPIDYWQNKVNEELRWSWAGSPRHLAALEGLAIANFRDKRMDTAHDLFKEERRLILSNPLHDQMRLAQADENIAASLGRFENYFEARSYQKEASSIKEQNSYLSWCFAGFLLAFIAQGLFMARALLESKWRISGWYINVALSMVASGLFAFGLFCNGQSMLYAMLCSIFGIFMMLPSLLLSTMSIAVRYISPLYHIRPSEKPK